MLIPYTTDAPVYHWPFATVGLIVLNVLIFVATIGGLASGAGRVDPDEITVEVVDENGQPVIEEDEEAESEPATGPMRFALALGQGLHPLQWLTHNFLHGDLMHLIGNMLFLWAYGIVVEGKIGWWWFLLLYLGIGIAHGASVQALMLGASPTYALGASAIIFGLLAVCMVWAPKNEVTCLAFFRFTFDVVEIPYMWIAAFNIFFELVDVFLHGFRPSSGLGHVSGAVWGFIAGVVFLKMNWVDCENWDLFAVLAGREGRSASDVPRRRERPSEAVAPRKVKVTREVEASPEERAATALARVQRRIEDGDLDGAIAAYDKAARTIPSWPGRDELYGLIKSFHQRGGEVASVPLMNDFCRRYPQGAEKVQLKLAQVLIRELSRPTKARRLLEGIAAGALPPDLERARVTLLSRAVRMQEEGVLELEED